MNTRLHARLFRESSILGPRVCGRGAEFLKNIPQLDKENKQLFIASLETSEHYHISYRFQNPPQNKLTRTDWQAVGPPYTPPRHAEMDMVMANRRAQNIIKNVESDTKTAFPSDHFPVNIRVKVLLAKHEKGGKKSALSWKSPLSGWL